MTAEEFLNSNKTQNIIEFEQGDRIVRVERAPFKQPFYNENLGIQTEVISHTDGSYIGEELEFLGIFNRMICLRRPNAVSEFDKKIIKLHIDQWQDGWQKYSIPNFD